IHKDSGVPLRSASRAAGVQAVEEPPVRQPDPASPFRTFTGPAHTLLSHWFHTPRPENVAQPEVEFGKGDANWWRVPLYDSALVSAADGSGKNIYTRDRAMFRRMLVDSWRLHRRLQREWPALSRRYRRALPDLVSEARWRATFEERS
ncbi:glycosyl transferase, partial [Microbacterium sp. SUBG005]